MRSVALLLACLATQLGEERVVVRRFGSEVELTTERFEIRGSEGETRETKRLPQQVRRQAEEIELVDTHADAEDPLASFTRHYATVTGTYEVGEARAPRAKTESARLAEKTVTFERERDGRYAPSCDDPDVRPALLRRLRVDLALSPFLPASGEGQEPGDTWELPNAELGRIFLPLESALRRPQAKDEPPRGGLSLAPAGLVIPIGALLLAPEGSVRATRLARESDEELAERARLEFRLRGTHDGSAVILAGRAGEAEDELVLTFQGSGTLAWDPARGAIELTLEGEARLEETFRAVLSGNGATAEIEGELHMSGRLSFEASERPE
jgi:hypothetical protein